MKHDYLPLDDVDGAVSVGAADSVLSWSQQVGSLPQRLGSFSRELSQLPALAQLLGQPVAWVGRPWLGFARRRFDALVGWGRRPSTVRARAFAQQHGLPFIALEDGFLRSYGTGDRFPPLSLVVDELGIYYDGTRPSALEVLLESDVDVLSGMVSDVARAKALVLAHRLSKYNHAGAEEGDGLLRCARNDGSGGRNDATSLDRHCDERSDEAIHASSCLPRSGSLKVLVVDQTAGDMSVAMGGANADTFSAMLTAARTENPQATIYVKTHPEVTSGRKGGYLTAVQDGVVNGQRTVVLRQAINPLSLIEQMDRVYVVTSTMGFEALLAGKPVSVFGMPWYAGWGATDDQRICPRRTRKRTVDELFAAAYFHYTRYLNPVTHERGTIFDVIDWLVRQRRMASASPGRTVAVAFRRWKTHNLKPMLGLDHTRVCFVATAQKAEALALGPADRLVFWGRTAPVGLAELARRTQAQLVRLEDGFVRSVGLGSDLVPPRSIVTDSTGLYFDPSQPSDLEQLLNTRSFSDEDLKRAAAVRNFMVVHGITKYNMEPRDTARWPVRKGQRVLLVPGQVEDDASIRFGCTHVRSNLALLKEARKASPQAFIVYKPHPDVMSGNRAGRVALDEARASADWVETGLSVVSCLDASDEVHTMTSLTGFDALLRGKRVVTYGQPFYAGWGLTVDRAGEGGGATPAFERRARRLTLDELVAGTLLHYPLYWDWSLKGFTTCEAVLNILLAERTALEAEQGLEGLRNGWLRRQWRKLQVLRRAWMHHL